MGDVGESVALARALFAGGDLRQARAICQRILKDNPSNARARDLLMDIDQAEHAAQRGETTIDDWLAGAKDAADAGDYAEAARCLEQVLAVDASNQRALEIQSRISATSKQSRPRRPKATDIESLPSSDLLADHPILSDSSEWENRSTDLDTGNASSDRLLDQLLDDVDTNAKSDALDEVSTNVRDDGLEDIPTNILDDDSLDAQPTGVLSDVQRAQVETSSSVELQSHELLTSSPSSDFSFALPESDEERAMRERIREFEDLNTAPESDVAAFEAEYSAELEAAGLSGEHEMEAATEGQVAEGNAPSLPPLAIPATKPNIQKDRVQGAPTGKRLLAFVNRRRLPLLTYVLVPLLALGVGFFSYRFWRASRFATQVESHANKGLLQADAKSIKKALLLLEQSDDEDWNATFIHLAAFGAYEFGEDEWMRMAKARLPRATANEESKLATLYLALAAGDLKQASSILSRADAVSAERDYLRARVHIAQGDIAQALHDIEKAYQAEGKSSLYEGLRAELLATNGDEKSARNAFAALANQDGAPIQLFRARGLFALGDLGRAASIAQKLAASEDTRRVQRSWANLILAQHGTEAQRRAAAIAAMQKPPPGSEAFVLELARVLLELKDVDRAYELLQRLPAGEANPRWRVDVTADVYFAAGDLDAVERVLEEAEDSPRATFLRARIAEAKGKINTALKLLKQVEDDPFHRRLAQLRLSAIYLDQGDTRRALETIRGSVREFPEDPDVRLVYAEVLLAKKELRKARNVLADFVKKYPDDRDAQKLMAKAELGRSPDTAMHIALRLLEQDSDDAELWALVIDAALRTWQPAHALDGFEKLREASRHDAFMGKKARAHLMRGEVLAAKDAVQQAKLSSGESRLLAALTLVVEGRGSVALEKIKEAPRSLLSSAERSVWMAIAEAQAEENKAARRRFERTVKHSTLGVPGYLAYAIVLSRRGDLGAATRQVGDASRLLKNMKPYSRWNAAVEAVRARIRFEHGAITKAEQLAKSALEADPESAEAHLVLAMADMERRDNPIEHLRKASKGAFPMPEVWGLIAIHGKGDERCEAAKRYLSSAPSGIDSKSVKKIVRRCP